MFVGTMLINFMWIITFILDNNPINQLALLSPFYIEGNLDFERA